MSPLYEDFAKNRINNTIENTALGGIYNVYRESNGSFSAST